MKTLSDYILKQLTSENIKLVRFARSGEIAWTPEAIVEAKKRYPDRNIEFISREAKGKRK